MMAGHLSNDSAFDYQDHRDYLTPINRLLPVLAGVFLLAAVYQIFFQRFDGLVASVREANIQPAIVEIRLPESRPFSELEPTLAERNIFSAVKPGMHPAEAISVQTAQQLQEMLRNIKVVGIVLDEQPQAIVRDLQKQETFFLYPGDRLAEATLTAIEEGKIIFNYEGQQMELTQ